MNHKEDLKYIYNDTVSWLKFIEAKTVLILGILTTLTYFLYENINTEMNLGIAYTSIVISIISISILIISVLGLSFKSQKIKDFNMLYYKSVVSVRRNDFYIFIDNLKDEKIINMIGQQIYDLAVVTDKKHKLLKISCCIHLISIIIYIFA